MIELRDTVVIDVPPERVWTWLDELPRHYTEWHPDHLSCRYEFGQSLREGAVLRIEERLHGRPHKLRLRATEVVPGRLVRYRSGAFSGAFDVAPAGEGTRFTAELLFGTRIPLLGSAVDVAASRLLGRRLAALRMHMREEGANLKGLLEREAAR